MLKVKSKKKQNFQQTVEIRIIFHCCEQNFSKLYRKKTYAMDPAATLENTQILKIYFCILCGNFTPRNICVLQLWNIFGYSYSFN